MYKNPQKDMPMIHDLNLAGISGGTGNWWEERGYYSQYSVGQRVHCSYFNDSNSDCCYMHATGTIKEIEFTDKGPDTFNYLIELDTPDSSGQKRHWVFFDNILGLA